MIRRKICSSLIVGMTLGMVGLHEQAFAQPLLDKLEDRVRQNSLGGPAAEPGYLGIVGDARQESGRGVRILEVLPGGPSAVAGLRVNDLIVAANDRIVRNEDDLAAVVEPLVPGDTVTFTVERGDATADLVVELGRRPPPDQRRFQQFGKLPEALPEPNSELSPPTNSSTRGRPVLGVRTQPVTRELAEQHGLDRVAGAVVVARTMDMPAARAGIPLNSIIIDMDGIEIRSPEDLALAVQEAGPGAEVDITYVVDGKRSTATVVLGSSDPSGSASTDRARSGSGRAPAAADRAMGADVGRIEELEKRVRLLEQRIAELEKLLSPQQAE